MKIFTKIAMTLAVAAISTSAFAGGPMTNTNQSAHFLRSVARGTSLSTDAVYTNPAGVVFMDNGFHIGLSDQMAAQTRTITSTYAPFAMGAKNGGQATKEFKGEVFSPLIPSVHFAWKHNRWAVMAGIGVNGGGGSLEFNDGLGSFERMFSVLPVGMQQLGIQASGYDMDMYLMGKSMTLAFNVGAAFRITDWLSIAAQVRYSSTSNAYEGHMKNINVIVGGQPQSASTLFAGALATMQGQYQQLVAAGMGDSAQAQQLLAGMQSVGANAVKTQDHILDVKQKGSSISPVVALAFHHGKWDASVKYEFEMKTELEIESAEVSAKDPVINAIFADGSKIKAETPALLAAAVSRHFGPVKVTAQWHHYFDKDAENSFSPVIEGNTNEYMMGVEWQISPKWLVSAGTQRTQLNMNENAYSDMNYSISSWSVGVGLAYQICDAVRLNLGYMPTIYDEVTAVGQANGVDFKDLYQRTSHAWGIGLDLKFGK
jgi:long-subunit fatty acid transport protein